MDTSVFRRVAAIAVRNCLISSCLLGSWAASGQSQAVRVPAQLAAQMHSQGAEARPVIALDPPTGWDLQIHSFDAQGNRLPEAPANFRRFGVAKMGEPADLHTLTLRFAETVTLHHIQSTPDFPIAPGGTCVEGAAYEANSSCTLLVKFTPQGPGRRVGFVSITHSASATPALVGLGGSGYAPVVSFTPSLITTVPVTVSAGKGVISSATNLAVASDTLYIADRGNKLLREIDSSGALTNITPFFATPVSVAVDGFGEIWTANQPSDQYYFSEFSPFGSQTAWGITYVTTTCTATAPCSILTVGMDQPANINIDPYDDLFLEDGTSGAIEMPVGGYTGGSGTLDLWHLNDEYSYALGPPAPFAISPTTGNLFNAINYSLGSTCYIAEESLYAAETTPVFTRVAGASKCGYSGDGGQAANAEISSSTGQIAFDTAGNLYFADSGNQRVRRIDAVTGIIRTIAGNGTAGYKGDGGTATGAELDAPTGVAVDSQGQVYILSNSATTGTAQVVRKVETTGALSFGSITTGTSSPTVILNVANTGNSSLSFVRETINGTNPADFSIDNNTTTCNFAAGNALNAGQYCQIGVIFKPGATGARAATMNLLDNTVNNVNQVKLTGTGVAPAVVKFTSPSAAQVITSGSKVNVAVTVTSAKGTAPTGKVNFSVDGKLVATGTIASGKASAALSGIAAGSHTLVAAYPGDSGHAAAKATESFSVSK
jgi:hypothetical protein